MKIISCENGCRYNKLRIRKVSRAFACEARVTSLEYKIFLCSWIFSQITTRTKTAADEETLCELKEVMRIKKLGDNPKVMNRRCGGIRN